MKNIYLLLLFVVITGLNALANKLNQPIVQNWKFRQVGKQEWYQAVIPGCVHTDLMDNKLIPDPYYRDTEKKVQWIENEDWEYQTTFDVTPSLFAMPNISLQFKGLDTYADVFLNDSLVLRADNMFRSWSIDCKNLLKERNNQLRILFHSAVKEGMKRVALRPYHLPNHNEKTPESRKSGSQTRKSPHQFGWDTHPRLVTCGIWRPVELNAWSDAKIDVVYYEPQNIDSSQATYSVKADLLVQNEGSYTLSVFVDNAKQPASQRMVELKKGTNHQTLQLNIKKPNLWWPNGMGKPNLYQMRLVLSNNLGKVDEKSDKIGVRTIEVVREPDSIGHSFYFRVNGKPLFIKGSNHVPPDALSTRINDQQYQQLIKDAVAANHNLLRVWGGAIYENPLFYDLCAENGILVWQDFMYACSMYPGYPDFLDNIKQETTEVVKQLRNNPALALWCGNNELLWGWMEWGWPHDKNLNISKADSAEIFNNYLKIFKKVIPEVINEYDPKTFYWSSSPDSESGSPVALTSGDLHLYSVWYGSQSIQTYKKVIPRFMSEYGVQSFQAYSTMKKYFAPEDLDLFSPVMMYRQRSVMPGIAPDMEGNKMLMRYILEDYKEPKNFEGVVYLSQLFQADAIKIATEAHRMNKPRCMGTMYWQLGDAWPNVGWSVIDYQGKKKAAYYTTKNAFQNVVVLPECTDLALMPETKVNVYINSDSLQSVSGKLLVELLDFGGKMLYKKEFNVSIEPLSNKVYFSIPAFQLLKGSEKNQVVLAVTFLQNQKELCRNHLYFSRPKSLMLEKPEIRVKTTQTTNGVKVELMTNTLAKSVYVSLPNGNDVFSDNFFDLIPGKKLVLYMNTKMQADEVAEQLQVKSLIDFH